MSASENTGPESLQPTYQYVWSRRYIDATMLRDKNTNADGLCDDERIYYLGDANFNITTLVNTGGDAVERYVYTPYGVLTVCDATWANIRSTSSYANAYTYTGRQLDAETGLYYYRARFYAPQLGRFVSRDPIGYLSDINVYAYVGGRAPHTVDPMGEWSCGKGITIEEAQRRQIGAATIACQGGRFRGVFLLDPTYMDDCVAACAYRHELLHVDQFTFYCPDFCSDPCNEGKVPEIPRFTWPAEQAQLFHECPAYRLEIACLKESLQDNACNPHRIQLRIEALEKILKGMQCDVIRLPPVDIEVPKVPEVLPPLIERLPPVIERLPPVDDEQSPIRRLPPIGDGQLSDTGPCLAFLV